MRYTTMFSLVPAIRRKWIIAQLLADRDPAAEVRSFTMRHFLLRMYDAAAKAEQDVMLRLARRQTIAKLVGEALGGVGSALVYVALGVLLALAAIPLAVAGTAVLAIRSGQTSLANLMYATNRLYEDGLYFTDFLEFCADAERRLPDRQRAAAPDGFERISAKDVAFTYPGSDAPALRGVSVEIKQGEVIAFVGENGSGKTTLAKILSGLYEPDTGSVLWDDTDLREVNPEELRGRTAVIAQDHTRWPLTALYNITMGTGKGEESLHAAAAVAGADEVIAGLPHGYRTLLDRASRTATSCRAANGSGSRSPEAFTATPAADLRRAHGRPRRPGRARPLQTNPAARRRPYGPVDHPPPGQCPLRRPDLRPGPRQGHRTRQPRDLMALTASTPSSTPCRPPPTGSAAGLRGSPWGPCPTIGPSCSSLRP